MRRTMEMAFCQSPPGQSLEPSISCRLLEIISLIIQYPRSRDAFQNPSIHPSGEVHVPNNFFQNTIQCLTNTHYTHSYEYTYTLSYKHLRETKPTYIEVNEIITSVSLLIDISPNTERTLRLNLGINLGNANIHDKSRS
jgi:hypothetical protein